MDVTTVEEIAGDSGTRPFNEFALEDVVIDDPFWNGWLKRNRAVTLRRHYSLLFETGRVDNLRAAAGEIDAPFTGMFFNDSDVYKWIEAASNCLRFEPDLSESIEKLVEIVAAAQQSDGYLNSYFTLREPDKRWTNLGMMHELYCAGHLLQAAVAHRRATGSGKLMNVALRFADLIDDIFRVRGRPGAPGHELIELALIELSGAVDEPRYLSLAKLFLERRGTEASGFQAELTDLTGIGGYGYTVAVDNFGEKSPDEFYREFFLDTRGAYDGRYAQDHCPVCEQSGAEGHAVRAMYLYAAITEFAIVTGDVESVATMRRIWLNMTGRRMYITGGIGSAAALEGFSGDFDLPNREAYSETCAAFGSILWNHRLGRLTGDSRYIDILERVLYNAFLAGISLDGTRFFYVNPLESDGSHHRSDWFNVACCPTNATRLLSSLERYVYLYNGATIVVNLFVAGGVRFVTPAGRQARLEQVTDYPWGGEVRLHLHLEDPEFLEVRIRKPGWCDEVCLKVNDRVIDPEEILTDAGYLVIRRTWSNDDEVILSFAMPVKTIIANPAVTENRGKVALQRGPIVYCLEEADNAGDPGALIFPLDTPFTARWHADLLEGCIAVEGDAWKEPGRNGEQPLYRPLNANSYETSRFRAIPYHRWDNRDAGRMRVWLRTVVG